MKQLFYNTKLQTIFIIPKYLIKNGEHAVILKKEGYKPSFSFCMLSFESLTYSSETSKPI